jgi:hypothetical protein
VAILLSRRVDTAQCEIRGAFCPENYRNACKKHIITAQKPLENETQSSIIESKARIIHFSGARPSKSNYNITNDVFLVSHQLSPS